MIDIHISTAALNLTARNLNCERALAAVGWAVHKLEGHH